MSNVETLQFHMYIYIYMIYTHTVYVAFCLQYKVEGILLLQTKLQPNLKPMSTLARLIPKVHPLKVKLKSP